jgi:GLPGLI family protein
MALNSKRMKKLYIICVFIFISSLGLTQINAGKIVFERRTNLEKQIIDGRMKNQVNENNKIRVELFDLYFNDTCSIFKPILSDEADPLSWATSRNTILQNFKSNEKLSELNISGQIVYVKDNNQKRNWKITESKRTIANFECYKAIWQKNDSTRIYAWFSIDIVPTVGPEGFDGLPGAILGLATEDGGIIYFAKSVELSIPKQEIFKIETGKKDVYSMDELKTKIEKDFGNTPRGKRILSDLFRWM